MLTTLRNNAQSWIIKVVLGLIVVTFIISFGVGTFSNPKEVLVDVGGKEILVTDFMREYQKSLDNLRQRFPNNADALAAQLDLRKQVMDRMVNRYIMLTAAHDAGLMVTDKEVRDSVTHQSAFQVNGRFDYSTYRQILAQNSLAPADYEAQLHDDLLLNKYQRNQVAGLIVSKTEIDHRYRIENEQVEVNYVYVDPSHVKLPHPPTEDDLKAYYKAHPDEFTQEAQFKLRYFVLPLSALEKGVTVRERAVERYFQRNADKEFTTPKQVRASHILRRLPKDATPKQVTEARKLLEGVLAKARAGESFAKLAKEYSQDFSAKNGGDLGFFTRDQMVPAFADAAFSLPKGGISRVVRSPFGLHIIKVTDIKPGSRKSLKEVHDQIEAKLRSELAERRLDQDVQNLPERLLKDSVETVAKSLGQSVQTTPLFDSQAVLPGLGSAGPLYALISKRHKGNVGVWRRNPVQGHVFYQIEERKEAHLKPLDAVKAQVMAATQEQQRRDRAIAMAKEAYQKLQDGAHLDAFAKRLGLKMGDVSFTVVDSSIKGIGVNQEFQRAAFGLNEKKPYALNIKDQKAYLIRFKRRFLPDPKDAAEKKAQIAQQVQKTLQQYVLDQQIQHLRSQVKVDVVSPGYLASSNAPAPRDRRY
ncbi:MAG TPA: SurA N-terminal domain-containing protein [bacterium]|nr:SurA N-terminal domain-containing protein [bacterium]